jgi:iron complex outermembrane receptor protein
MITPGDQASWENGPNNDPTKAATVMDASGKPLPTIPGAQVFPGFQPANSVDRTRNNVGVYTGFESEIVKGLNVDVGGRYENYSDFGNSLTGKAAVRVPLGTTLAVRGAASAGFRAPSLQQLWFSNTSTRFIQNQMTGALEPNQVLTVNNASPVAGQQGFGIPPLKQETSQNASAGITFRPLGNLSLTADAYFIRLKNRITLTNQFQINGTALGQDVGRILAQFPGINAVQFFANAIDTDTMGADIVGDYALDTRGVGTVVFSGALNLTKTEVKAVHAPGQLTAQFANVTPDAFANVYFDRLARNYLEDAVPHAKGNAAIRYAFKGLSALLRAEYYGQVKVKPDLITRADGSIQDDAETFGAKVLFDANLGYQFTKNLAVTIGADNIFNTFPDKNTKANNISLGRFVYNRNVTQFGLNGGFYYGKLELTFF